MTVSLRHPELVEGSVPPARYPEAPELILRQAQDDGIFKRAVFLFAGVSLRVALPDRGRQGIGLPAYSITCPSSVALSRRNCRPCHL